MNDPTYDKEEIKKNPRWHAAWIMSECLNHQAPLGWGYYLNAAAELDKAGLLKEAD